LKRARRAKKEEVKAVRDWAHSIGIRDAAFEILSIAYHSIRLQAAQQPCFNKITLTSREGDGMSDNNQTNKLIAPVLSVNIGALQRPVVHVRNELSELADQRVAKLQEIDETDPENTNQLEKLTRDLTLIDNTIILLDDVLIARGHARRPIADSA
jgi:hypothetical protein